MKPTTAALTALFDRIPRRHSPDNVKEINCIVTEYEDLLIQTEAVDTWYEKNTTVFFEQLDEVRALVKKSTDNKASKKSRDNYFDEASGALKDSIQALIHLIGEEKKTV